MRLADLLTWSGSRRTESANEVAQIIDKPNNSLKEESGSRRIKQNAKSH
jgi:hypothetical protein